MSLTDEYREKQEPFPQSFISILDQIPAKPGDDVDTIEQASMFGVFGVLLNLIRRTEIKPEDLATVIEAIRRVGQQILTQIPKLKVPMKELLAMLPTGNGDPFWLSLPTFVYRTAKDTQSQIAGEAMISVGAVYLLIQLCAKTKFKTTERTIVAACLAKSIRPLSPGELRELCMGTVAFVKPE